jgi:hypothetical protein
VQDHAALELDVERALAERPLGRLAHHGEGLDQQVVQVSPLASRSRNSVVLARSASSESFSNAGSSALIFATGLSKPLTILSLAVPNKLRASAPSMKTSIF